MFLRKEIFVTAELQQLREKEEILAVNHLEYRIKKSGGEARASINLTGREAFLSDIGSSVPPAVYRILVKKKDAAFAFHLLHQG